MSMPYHPYRSPVVTVAYLTLQDDAQLTRTTARHAAPLDTGPRCAESHIKIDNLRTEVDNLRTEVDQPPTTEDVTAPGTGSSKANPEVGVGTDTKAGHSITASNRSTLSVKTMHLVQTTPDVRTTTMQTSSSTPLTKWGQKRHSWILKSSVLNEKETPH